MNTPQGITAKGEDARTTSEEKRNGMQAPDTPAPHAMLRTSRPGATI